MTDFPTDVSYEYWPMSTKLASALKERDDLQHRNNKALKHLGHAMAYGHKPTALEIQIWQALAPDDQTIPKEEA